MSASVKQFLKKIPQSKLGVSEPNPAWFGNRGNEKSNPAWTNDNWLKSRFHFSFAEYSNPHNMGFGILRVMNDDLVQPDRGFGEHPHREVEICTYVVDGELTHKDSMGTSETIGRGAIQFMTAGKGITHSEKNLSKKNPLRFIQIWMYTRHKGLKPNYGSFNSGRAARTNIWAHLVTDVNNPADVPIKIHQDANIFVTEITPGNTVDFTLQEGRQAYLLCVEGAAVITGDDGQDYMLERHDAAELYGAHSFTVKPLEASDKRDAHLLMVEMAYTGRGRSDL